MHLSQGFHGTTRSETTGWGILHHSDELCSVHLRQNLAFLFKEPGMKWPPFPLPRGGGSSLGGGVAGVRKNKNKKVGDETQPAIALHGSSVLEA